MFDRSEPNARARRRSISSLLTGRRTDTPRQHQPILEVDDLHVWFDRPRKSELHAVQGISLDVHAGERLGLVGESGCGKTTAMLSIMGLLPPNATIAGQVTVDGKDLIGEGEVTARLQRWRTVAMVFQGAMNAFNPVKRIRDQIVEPMEFHGTSTGRAAKSRATELLQLVGISATRGDRYPHEFSGGMRQRAAIAMALACNPSVLLADEPTTALDVMTQAQILELLVSLTSEFDLALVLVTHDLPIVAQVCDRAAVMYAGSIVEQGPVDSLFHAPGHPYTRLLFAATPDLYGTENVASIPGTPPPLDRPYEGCPFTPRCDRAFEPCAVRRPQLLRLDAGHSAACHLNDPSENAP